MSLVLPGKSLPQLSKLFLLGNPAFQGTMSP
jgi:hypothetical protein